ncbi:MAG: SRPBCC domain-containing protein [Thermoplasmata archaeon]|nr:SRPBCC domain-containing protein [Thermoplasmata archaeon]
MWTTKAGIESWWNPEHLRTTVRNLDVRPGGEFEIAIRYGSTATQPAMVQAFESAGVPLNFVIRGRFSEVVPPTQISFHQYFDLGPPSDPYDIFTRVEFRPIGDAVRLVLTADAVPSAHWTTLALAGLNGQVDRLVAALRR